MHSQSYSHLLVENRRFPPTPSFARRSHLSSQEKYREMYRQSIEQPDSFWLEQANKLRWIKKPQSSCRYMWDTKARRIEHTWFEDGILNVSVNCLDRHLEGRAHKTALIWQGENDEEVRQYTFKELHEEVCRFANLLKAQGIRKGDRICLYLPMIPELAIFMLACSRIGAIHSVIFGGYSKESIIHRVHDSSARLLITANEGQRGGKIISLKKTVDDALEHCPTIEKVIVVKHTETFCPMLPHRDVWLHEEIASCSAQCEPESMLAEDPLFILYTSGSTGKPKGVVHTQAGYLLYAALTHYYVFDIQEDDIYWCTADLGWVTGHSYGVYGPLCNGTTILLFEGIPTYPDPGRFWQIIEKYRVSVFYTAPTVIRSLIRSGNEYPNRYDLSSLRVLGSVGEPINPEAWMWDFEVIGKGRCPLVDTWWQTETGGILITPLPGCHTLKPGSASKPFFGIEPVILRDDGTPCHSDEGGSLCIRKPWPGIMRTLWGDHSRFIDYYFSNFNDMYFSGDGCRKDKEGDYWLLGRLDDVVNIAGHRIGTAEVESALVSDASVAEAAVVPIFHEIKGQGLFAFVTLKEGIHETHNLKEHLKHHVRRAIGAIAVPEEICFARGLPKTRSGKIMRRILRKIANRETDDLGDTTTLADQQVIKDLIEKKSIKEDN